MTDPAWPHILSKPALQLALGTWTQQSWGRKRTTGSFLLFLLGSILETKWLDKNYKTIVFRLIFINKTIGKYMFCEKVSYYGGSWNKNQYYTNQYIGLSAAVGSWPLLPMELFHWDSKVAECGQFPIKCIPLRYLHKVSLAYRVYGYLKVVLRSI